MSTIRRVALALFAAFALSGCEAPPRPATAEVSPPAFASQRDPTYRAPASEKAALRRAAGLPPLPLLETPPTGR